MITRADFITDWGQKANAKLQAENVDRSDLEAVEKCLLECVGGRRLFNAWVEYERGKNARL